MLLLESLTLFEREFIHKMNLQLCRFVFVTVFGRKTRPTFVYGIKRIKDIQSKQVVKLKSFQLCL